MRDQRGVTLLEMLFTISVIVTATTMAVPYIGGVLDDVRTAAAARYVAGRIGSARLDAVKRSDAVALRFNPADGDYQFAVVGDGNGNGVRTADIQAGVDEQLTPFERLGDRFPGVRFELGAGVPDADGRAGTGTDGVRVGTARILTMSSDGTATSGTLYIRGRRGQFAVRVLGATGRTRMLQYQSGSRSWISR
jgi:prepilin-type N-terminal cleavage/methylation domain-containing protein